MVDNKGLVTGVKEGKATITGVIDNENSLKCEVTVTAKDEQNVNPPVVTHKYEISETSISIKASESAKLYISDNGTTVNGVTWKSSNVNVVTVDSSGTIVGVKEGKATITGTIDNQNSLKCEVTVTASDPVVNPDSEITKFCKSNADYVDGTSYYFVSSKSKWDYLSNQSYIWNLYFMYDSSDNICVIKSQLNAKTSSGLSFNYYGYNTFYWGSYKTGLFIGGYNQEKSKDSGTYANFEIEFDNTTIIYRTDYSLSYVDLSYTVKNNEFSSSPTADDVLAVFSRVSECCSYADEMFKSFKVNLTLY